MSAASTLRFARRKANLSQRELGLRAGATQATISRIEDGVVSPRFETMERLLSACGFELHLIPKRGIGVDRTAIRRLLHSNPTERARLAAEEARNMEKIVPSPER
jgi:transcriptional regulator with XRE-family HTH domain